MAARVPHTYRRNGTYYIRLKWPSKIYQTVPDFSREFNHSLQTHDQHCARFKASLCVLRFRQLVDFIDTCLIFGRMDQIDHESIVATLKATVTNAAKDKLRMSDTPEFIFDPSNQLFVDIDPDTGRPVLKSDLKDKAANQQEILEAFKNAGMGLDGLSLGPIETGPTVEDVSNLFVKEKVALLDWEDESTYSQGVSRLKDVVAKLGPTKIFATLTKIDVLKVKDAYLSKVDPKRERRSPIDGTMSADTARSYFQLCTALVKYAAERDIISSNFAAGMSLKVKKGSSKSYRSFDESDMEKIINGSIYRLTELKTSRKLHDSYFWAPLIAMFTGGRINEICQLKLRDISFEKTKAGEPIWFIRINDDEVDQSVKNESSKRRVPIHDQLIDLGFLDYYQRRCGESTPNDTLFVGVKYCKSNGWGREVSRWFNGESASPGYLDTVQLTSRRRKTFHSFRHTAATVFRNIGGVGDPEIAATIGHENRTTTSRYGQGYTLDRLKDIVNKLDYGLDLSHISFEKFEEYKICKGRPEKNKHLLYAHKKQSI